MKRILIFAALAVLLFLGKQPVVASFERKEDFSLFSDPGFTQPTHNFSSGQMVYVRVKTSGSGDQEKILRVLDASKKEIQKLTLKQEGNGPYTYKVSFPAPQNSGIYYVDIKIKNEGFSFASQENINVGESQSSGEVLSEAESVVVQNSQLPSPSPTIEPTATPEPQPETLPIEVRRSFVSRLIEFFRQIFSRLSLDKLI